VFETLCSFLFADFDDIESEEEESEHILRSTLIRRINSEHSELSDATLRLFSVLISKYSQQVMWNLILRSFIVRHQFQDSFRNSPLLEGNIDPEILRSTIRSFLRLLGHSNHDNNYSSSCDAYLIDARQQVSKCQAACVGWSLREKLNMKEVSDEDSEWASTILFESIQIPNSNVASTRDNSFQTKTSFDDSRLINEFQKEITKECQRESFYGCGLFLAMLLDKLEKLPFQSMETNLLITGIFTKLCHYPFPVLYTFLLLKPELFLRPRVRCLWTVLTSLSKQITQQAASVPNFHEALASTIDLMSSERELVDKNGPNIEPTSTFLQAAVVFEEFSKELAAILAFWAST